MSKIGRQPIDISGVTVGVEGCVVRYKGPLAEGEYELPAALKAEILEGDKLLITPSDASSGRGINMIWGLHRALIANRIIGARTGFKKELKIAGLGYKGIVQGDKILFSLGYSHKIDFTLPSGVSVSADKTGQTLTVSGTDKQAVGQVASDIKALRPVEPYKGHGIRIVGEYVFRKAGKAKA